LQGGKRLYNVEKYLKQNENYVQNNIKYNCGDNIDELDKIEEKLNICYVRVSSIGQKDDLERQKKMMQELYPNYYIIEDIGSFMKNFVFHKSSLIKKTKFFD